MPLSDEVTNALVVLHAKARLRRLRVSRTFAQLMTFTFALLFAYVVLGEPQLTLAGVLTIGGSLVGVFAGSSVATSIGAEVQQQKMFVLLAKRGLFVEILEALEKEEGDS